ncbi:MAG: hypothetical protein G01um101418_874 [Parcubacteria group bacterium Gr01-1014_18]|nr:MAG: hypothetical protein Greene041636_834 [Parcubacteria group bacterium Greene0416_36]TSC79875.1 MAG: hypothetical protein G01um101418_874 [Parcubacteria group bacterium Gr01-1014_18]TSC98307.1 MAG: hypothetical protein Greene101420_811 [Parcubacteria group bacterium Greene1014_20]TSD06652.1 MAG: hypothetical protein Greene07142_704 [Parcubacteria group bacterium Greene0714_2]
MKTPETIESAIQQFLQQKLQAPPFSLTRLTHGASGQHWCWKIEPEDINQPSFIVRTQNPKNPNFDIPHQYTLLSLIDKKMPGLAPKPHKIYFMGGKTTIMIEEFMQGNYWRGEEYLENDRLHGIIRLIKKISDLGIHPEDFPYRKFQWNFRVDREKWIERLSSLLPEVQAKLQGPLMWTKDFLIRSERVFQRAEVLLEQSHPQIHHTGTYLENIKITPEGPRIHSWTNVLFGNPAFMLARFCSQNPSRAKLVNRIDEIQDIYFEGTKQSPEFKELLLWTILWEEFANISWIIWTQSEKRKENPTFVAEKNLEQVLIDLNERIQYIESFREFFLK